MKFIIKLLKVLTILSVIIMLIQIFILIFIQSLVNNVLANLITGNLIAFVLFGGLTFICWLFNAPKNIDTPKDINIEKKCDNTMERLERINIIFVRR
jgi:hypothetical protein